MMFALPAILDQQTEQVIPEEDFANYCPQNNTGFYTIDYDYQIEEDTCNYCPQDTTGFYDFAQAP